MPQIDLEPEHYRDNTPAVRRWGQIIFVGAAVAVAIAWMTAMWFAWEQPMVVIMTSTVAVVVIAALVFIGAWLRSYD